MQKFIWAVTRKVYDVLGPANAWRLAMSPPVVFTLKTIAYIAGNRTIPFTTKYGLTLKLRIGDILFGGYLHLGESNPLEIYVLRNILNPNDIVVDVGAHLGWYTVNSAQMVGSGGTVYAFEPNPSVAAWLAENCKLNGLTNVRIERIALADKNSTTDFFVGGADSLGSLKLINAKRSNLERVKRIKVPLRSLDRYLKMSELKKLKLIKVDAEGADLEVLKGAAGLLRKLHPYLIVEVFGLTWNTDVGRDKKIISYLQSLGYHPYSFEQGGLRKYFPTMGQPQIINLFFAHRETELRKLRLI